MSNLELNKGDNFIWLIDRSRSMAIADCGPQQNIPRIEHIKETVKSFIHVASKFDTDGADVTTFGAKVTPIGKGVTPENAATLIDAIQADEGSTDTAAAIRSAYQIHKDGGYKQSVAFIATDGEPNDEDSVFREIARITQELKDEHEFALSFLTVGKRSDGLAAFLTKLDDDVPGAKYDIVDVKALDEVDFATAFDGALHD